MSFAKLIQSIEYKPSYGKTYLMEMMKKAYELGSGEEVGVELSILTMVKPNIVKKGDVFVHHVFDKQRPCVVYSVTDDLAYVIPMSSKALDGLNSIKVSNRFGIEGYFTRCLIAVPKSVVTKNFVGVIEEIYSLEKAYELINELK